MKLANIYNLKNAVEHIKRAQEDIMGVAQDESWGTGRADCLHYAQEIEALLHADNDQAGLIALIKILERQGVTK